VGDGKDGWVNHPKAKAFWKILFVAAFATCLASIFIVISMYWWPNIPSSPHPSEGRIYPLNNHGYYTYMDRSEYLLNRTLQGIFLLLFAASAGIAHFADPFDFKRKRQSYGLPPRDFK
jgi:CRISPR-associated Cas5-like protein